MGENLGHRVVWERDLPGSLGAREYVVTDHDLDLRAVPTDVYHHLSLALDRHPGGEKCGLSLEIQDLPMRFPLRYQVREWEGRFWRGRTAEGYFRAPVDTTFALYRSGRRVEWYTGDCLRCNMPYVARHLPWYLSPADLDEEQRFYIEATRTESHWTGSRREHEAYRRAAPSGPPGPTT